MEYGCWGVPRHGLWNRTALGWEGEGPLTRQGPGPGSGKACMFLAPPNSGSCQSPGVGELMATNVLVSPPQAPRLPPLGSGHVLSPATSWGLCTSAGRRDSAQRQWEQDAGGRGAVMLSAGASQGGRELGEPHVLPAGGPADALTPAQDQPAGPALVLSMAALLPSAGAVSTPPPPPIPLQEPCLCPPTVFTRPPAVEGADPKHCQASGRVAPRWLQSL